MILYFMLSEEDKGNKASLQWFSCVDIDGDGKITPRDMRFFYDVQTARMESLGHDVVNFSDVLCQMSDMIKPSEVSYDFYFSYVCMCAQTLSPTGFFIDPFVLYMGPIMHLVQFALTLSRYLHFSQNGEIVLSDLLREDIVRVAGIVFDALFNLDKFIQFEQRDPFAERQKRDDPFDTDGIDSHTLNTTASLKRKRREKAWTSMSGTGVIPVASVTPLMHLLAR